MANKDTLKDIRVINGGSNYENRQLHIKPTGINTSKSTINFKNHGFSNGDNIVYETKAGIGTTQPQTITELNTYTGITTTSNYYKVLLIDENTFQLANAGLGGTSFDDFNRFKFIKFDNQGTGFQVFKYPDIKLNISYELKNTDVGVITATPVVRGSINDIYLYEEGSGYGSEILNLEKPVNITRKKGQDLSLIHI